MQPFTRRHWIFDLDGTLTVAVHDFAAMRRTLGIPPGVDMIDWINAQPPAQATALHRTLDTLEHEYAAMARPADGVADLLDALDASGCRLGLLTRNTRTVARRVLRTLCLDHHFAAVDVIGRHEAPPKPRPDGIHALLRRWQTTASEAVMVGDHVHDLLSGRGAGTATLLIAAAPPPDWVAQADYLCANLAELHARWSARTISDLTVPVNAP